MNKINVSVVSYVNSLPFVQGLIQSEIMNSISLSLDTPSVCAAKIISGQSDIGLLPVAVLPELPFYHIISDFCIGTNSEARSVLLISKSPLDRIYKVYLDKDSRTSVNLAKLLAIRLWHISVEWVWTSDGFSIDDIQEGEAAVIIGDKALKFERKFPFQLDLAVEWKKLTGLPFVFAAWVSTKQLDDNFIKLFNKALAHGIKNIDAFVNLPSEKNVTIRDLKQYLTENINYHFDEEKKKAMNLYLSMLAETHL